MLKPDIINRNLIGKVLAMIEENGFKILKIEKKQLSLENSKEFYESHKEKFFFNDMVKRINESEVVGVLLYKDENPVESLRILMGATNPANADEGTIRKAYGISIDENSIHGSDSFDNVKREAVIFFEK